MTDREKRFLSELIKSQLQKSIQKNVELLKSGQIKCKAWKELRQLWEDTE